MIRGPEFRLVARKSGRSESGEARYTRNQHSTRQDPIHKYTSCGGRADQTKSHHTKTLRTPSRFSVTAEAKSRSVISSNSRRLQTVEVERRPRNQNGRPRPRPTVCHDASYFASGSGRSWKCAARGRVPLPPSISQGARSPLAAHNPRPFQPAFGSSIRPSKPFA
jgi:hypothetical protein